MSAATTLLITIDGLRAAPLGPYGQTAYDTPAFDRLATEGGVFDRCFASTPHAGELFVLVLDTVMQGGATPLLVTDDAELAIVDRWRAADGVRLSPEPPRHAAEEIGDTTFATTLSSAAEAIAEHAGALPPLVWVHLRGMYGPWDAPPSLIDDLLDEDDSPIEPSVVPPEMELHAAPSDDAAEARFAASCRYAAQVRVLDACLDGFLEVMGAIFGEAGFPCVVAGLRGFPLGEHGAIGGVDRRLFPEQQQTPVLSRTRHIEGSQRQPHPIGLIDALSSSLFGTRYEPRPLMLASPGVAESVITAEWTLRLPTGDGPDDVGAELYVKPDDRFDHNDVASLCQADVAELLALLRDRRAE